MARPRAPRRRCSLAAGAVAAVALLAPLGCRGFVHLPLKQRQPVAATAAGAAAGRVLAGRQRTAASLVRRPATTVEPPSPSEKGACWGFGC